MNKLYLIVYWLDSQPRVIEQSDESEAIECAKDLQPLMDKVFLFVTDDTGGVIPIDVSVF